MGGFQHQSGDTESNPGLQAQDITVLLNTIKEYTLRLRAAIPSKSDQMQRLALSGAISAGGLAVLTLSALSPQARRLIGGESWKLDMVGVAAAVAVLTAPSAWLASLASRRSRLEVEVAAMVLQRLVRRALQMFDKGRLLFSDRILIEVVLADAEAALHQSPDAIPKRESYPLD